MYEGLSISVLYDPRYKIYEYDITEDNLLVLDGISLLKKAKLICRRWNQSWAPTTAKVSDNRHQQATANTR